MVEVSVVIPTKNEEKYIGKVLNNIYNQSFKDFEVIVSDGNSTDITKSEVESLIPKLIHNSRPGPKYTKFVLGVILIAVGIYITLDHVLKF